jgi:hypothetical protein
VEDRVVGIFPALIDEALFVGAMIFDKSVLVGIARPINPGQGGSYIWPQRSERFDVAGVLDVESGQQHEQWGRICGPIVERERHLTERGHFAAPHFVRDFSGLGVGQRVDLDGLIGGKPSENALGDARVAPQRLQRGNDPIAAECGGVPGNAGIRVWPLRRVGGQHGEVCHRAAQHLVENLIRGDDGRQAAAGGLALLECAAQAFAKRQRQASVLAALTLHRHIN